MTLPETMTVINLLDLAGKYLGLNYVYDPRDIANQSVSLKLHGSLQGEMKVKHLYTLLETVLHSMGLVMIRREPNLVTIVPMDKALQTQPQLIDSGGDAVQIGDTVVIRAFKIQYVDVGSIKSLLESMKLVIAATPVDESDLLLVTCHADRLVMETTKDKDGKIEKIPKTQERVTIVPDPNTFSLIVYASYKNQKRIAELIRKLDKRRPQVLIDVTLVEITRTDTFEYDLSTVARANGPVTGNVVVDPIQTADRGSRLEAGFNLQDRDGSPTGQIKAFYSDENVQTLLTAMQRKNYGRVLAKPKVLVDDGCKGEILTKDTTTYVKESIQVPQTGTPITTRDFIPVEASIDLRITPHISEGRLLRLDVVMSRDDFGTRPLSGAPPDKATSEVTTTVFVPNDGTVILGGLVKLNQSKGGSKVPILGDLPLIGILFRTINNNDVEKKLYVFLKADIVRPYDGSGLTDLQQISEEHRRAFEESESEFQHLEAIPGVPPRPMPPDGVLRDYK